jgi:hypothetical protein
MKNHDKDDSIVRPLSPELQRVLTEFTRLFDSPLENEASDIPKTTSSGSVGSISDDDV